MLSTRLSFEQYLEEKSSTVKFAMNAFNKLICNNQNPFSRKIYAFRETVNYGAQVFGNRMYNKIEVIQCFFIKKILYLPSDVPDYTFFFRDSFYHFYSYLKITFKIY